MVSLNRMSVGLSRWSRRWVPNTFVLAIFLTLLALLICRWRTPLGWLELGRVWVGEGRQPLMRKDVRRPRPWVVEQMEFKGPKTWRLTIWSKTSPSTVAGVLAADPKIQVLRLEPRAVWLRGVDRPALESRLMRLTVPSKIRGIWHFLSFAMQMCLILLTGYALAVSKPVMRMVRFLAGIPTHGAAAAAWVSFVSMLAGWINWGFGLVVGAYFAREVARRGEERGIPMHYPLLGAAGYSAMLVWHGGLSGSAPLKVAEVGHLTRELGLQMGPIPLQQTIFSPLNIAVTLGLLIAVPLLCRSMSPQSKEDILPLRHFVRSPSDGVQLLDQTHSGLDRWWGFNLLLGGPMLGFFFWQLLQGRSPSLNSMILLFFSVGLLLHRGVQAYMEAAAEGGRSCVGIILQFPLYAGIFAMVYESGLVDQIAQWLASASSPSGFLLGSFASAGLLNLFVPSGGGQWGIQGTVVLSAAKSLNVPPGTAVMTVAYGDQWTNMLQPFWALALLEITGLRARDLLGYTIILMLASGLLFGLGLLLFQGV
ncbi:MAG: short-chain fatty acid transporter [Myxococcales bacterium]|nr:short-chain fatty acid transporter [Myxococcales bacterium]